MSSTKKKAILIVMLALLLILTNGITYSLALFSRTQESITAQVLSFGNVEISATIADKVGSNYGEYNNFITQSYENVLAGTKTPYKLKIVNLGDNTAYIRLNLIFELQLAGSNTYDEYTYVDEGLNVVKFITLDILDADGGASVVSSSQNDGIFYKFGDYLYYNNTINTGSSREFFITFNIDESFGSFIDIETITNRNYRIKLYVESVQENQGYTAWGFENLWYAV